MNCVLALFSVLPTCDSLWKGKKISTLKALKTLGFG